MYFVLGLVLVVIIIIKVNKDKKEVQQTRAMRDAWREDDRRRLMRWELLVVYDQLEEELSRRWYDKDEALLSEIEETARLHPEALCGFELCDVLCDHDYSMRILMANRGKLRSRDSHQGILIGGLGVEPWQQRDDMAKKIAYVKWINDSLKSKKIDYPMYFIPSLGSTRVLPLERADVGPGYVVWEPAIPNYKLAYDLEK